MAKVAVLPQEVGGGIYHRAREQGVFLVVPLGFRESVPMDALTANQVFSIEREREDSVGMVAEPLTKAAGLSRAERDGGEVGE